LHEVFGGVENGRYRGFSVPIEKSNVMSISFSQKLAAHCMSLELMKDTPKFVVNCQHAGCKQVGRVKHSSATFVVINAMHEAAREVVASLEDGESEEQSAIANALWPALVKFVGKAVCSLTVANLFSRNGVWSTDGDIAWVDDTTHFGDALAAALKVLVHLTGQAWCEAYIAAAGASKVHSGRAALCDEPGIGSEKPHKLTPEEVSDPETIGLRILAALSWRDDAITLLKGGGIKDKFDDKKHPALR